MENKKGAENLDKGRRKFVLGLLGVGIVSVLASVASLIRSLVPKKSEKSGYFPTVAAGDVLVFAAGDKKDQPITPDNLALGDGVLAYPKKKGANQANLTIVMHLEPEMLKPPTKIDWTVNGLVAYSALCTHLSCTVSWDKKKTIQGSEIECFCHNSIFDPRRGAIVLAGPAPVPLPQLPIALNDQGVLIAKGSFEGPVGPQM